MACEPWLLQPIHDDAAVSIPKAQLGDYSLSDDTYDNVDLSFIEDATTNHLSLDGAAAHTADLLFLRGTAEHEADLSFLHGTAALDGAAAHTADLSFLDSAATLDDATAHTVDLDEVLSRCAPPGSQALHGVKHCLDTSPPSAVASIMAHAHRQAIDLGEEQFARFNPKFTVMQNVMFYLGNGMITLLRQHSATSTTPLLSSTQEEDFTSIIFALWLHCQGKEDRCAAAVQKYLESRLDALCVTSTSAASSDGSQYDDL